MINKRFWFLVVIIIFFVGCKKLPNPQNPIDDDNNQSNPIDEDVVEVDPIQEILDTLTLEEKIGQLLIVGKEGLEINDDDRYQMDNNRVGGFIFFSRNIDNENQVLKMLNDLKTYNSNNKIPLFLSVDEEGGTVSRLSKFYKSMPTARAIGEKDNENLSLEYGKILGLRLKSLGFNLDFAPALDINSNPKNPVIGSRSFGSTAEIVINNGIPVMEGLRMEGIISSVKHFPGHGDTSVDSHMDLPKVVKTYEELENLEFVPFKEAIKAKVDMIMVAHILFPQLDSEFPATLSKEILNNLLREEFAFNGIIISDDMTMGAITKNYTLEEATMAFLKNGGDIALICHGKDNPTLVIEKIKESIANEEISIDDINHKVYRILSIKHKYNLKDEVLNEINKKDLDKRTNDLINKIND